MRRKSTLREFTRQSNIIHSHKYDYSKSVYVDAKTKVIIICPLHGEFLQTPDSHLHKRGCSFCGKNKKMDRRMFITNASIVHSSRYNYSQVSYINNHTKVVIKCLKHGNFSQLPKDHLKGVGCPKCKASKGELKIIDILNKLNIHYVYQYWNKRCRSNIGKKQVLRFDFYIPSKNLLIEFDGKQHFHVGRVGSHTRTMEDLKYVQYHDKIKTQYATQAGIRLCRIKYTQFSRIEQILRSEIMT